jgi:2-dehydro-3-deoxygluconokinase
VIAHAAVFHATGITLALGPDPAAAIREAMELARGSGTIVSFDLNYRRALWSTADAAPALTEAVRGADVVFAGAEEAAIVAGTGEPAAAARTIAAMGPSQVLIKLGADGCLALIDGTERRLRAPAVTVVDTVGAGDGFAAGYLAELIAGAPPDRRVATAVAAGAMAVTVSGDWEGLPDRTALELLSSTEPVIR